MATLSSFTLSPDQKGIETVQPATGVCDQGFTLSPDQKGIETSVLLSFSLLAAFTLSPDQKGIETRHKVPKRPNRRVHTEPRSKGD